ncbi:MAG TPA: NAD-binding protein [Ktedonobacterales bacterium]|nr:NAD-binding protein [Ktedonobacterales bacterium]
MKIVIVGCGRVGANLAILMARDPKQANEVIIIDQNSDAFERLGQDPKNRIKTVIGDGIDEDILRKAGLEGADAFIAVTAGDNRNILAAQIAKYRFKVPKVICRIYDPIRQATYKQLGLDSISPTVLQAKLLRDALLGNGGQTDTANHAIATGAGVPVVPLPENEREHGTPTPQR